MAPAPPLIEREWFRTLSLMLLTGLASLVVSGITSAWTARDWIEKREERLIAQIRAERAQDLARFLPRDEWNTRRYEDAEKLAVRLDALRDLLRVTR